MSPLLYGIEVWGPAATEGQLKQMQALQNSVMRFVCNEKRGAKTKDLLRMTGMLSMRQLIVYRVLMTGLSTDFRGKPNSMSNWSTLKMRRLKTTQRSFRYMFGEIVNRLPLHIKEGDPKLTKHLIKDWVRDNIPFDRKWNSSQGSGEDSGSDSDDEGLEDS